jgi:RNA polymerase sigma factor (sigma-70 family)
MRRLTDAEQRALLEQARHGAPAARERALGELLADFRGPALAAAHKALASCGVDAVHGEEVLQEAILKFLHSGLPAFKGEAAPRTYFVRIAINAALDTARRLARTRELDEARAGDPGGGPAPTAEEGVAAAEARAALAACLERLGARYRRCVELYYLEELGDCAACGERVGISRSAFMQRLCRARAMLAECMRRRLR